MPSVFVLGRDYHLGDLLWLTAVLQTYRRQCRPSSVTIVCPDRPISRILENNPLIDRIVYGDARTFVTVTGASDLLLRVHDLRMLPIAAAMIRGWKRRTPWLYYRDLWLAPRGQWLATFLGLGEMRQYRPILRLCDADRVPAAQLPKPYVVLAPHTGQYAVPLVSHLWHTLKSWAEENWMRLAAELRRLGFEVVTLAARNQAPVPGTVSVLGLPIRQAAAVLEGATGLITGESGLWFVAAALGTPFVVVPWWLPRSVDWASHMGTPYCLVSRADASVEHVLYQLCRLLQPSAI